MKEIKIYEFKDLSIDMQESVIEKATNDHVLNCINFLEIDLETKAISEKEFYNRLGCSKFYAESTGWFVPHCYYEKHKKAIDKLALLIARNGLYLKDGRYVQSLK